MGTLDRFDAIIIVSKLNGIIDAMNCINDKSPLTELARQFAGEVKAKILNVSPTDVQVETVVKFVPTAPARQTENA